MATRGDVVKERRRYKWIRRVLGLAIVIFLGRWLYLNLWDLFLPEFREEVYGKRDFVQDILVTFEWFFCVNILPFYAQGAVKNYWFYSAFFAGFLLWYYLRHLASFKCPYCRKVIDLNNTWTCPSCNQVITRPLWYTIFHKCNWSKCKEVPDGSDCPYCGKTIYLLGPAPQLRSLPPGESPPEDQSRIARFPGTGS